MLIGVPKEIKDWENRVGLTPHGVEALCRAGNVVLVQKNAGVGSGFSDSEYKKSGAKIVETAKEAWDAGMVIKIKEPRPEEYMFLRQDLLLFTYLHLAADPELTRTLLEKKVNAVGYETVQLDDRSLPLLAPMSEVAGKLAAQVGAEYSMMTRGGRGILPGGIKGVHAGNYLIIGAGMVGRHAAEIAVGLGANVTLCDINMKRLEAIKSELPPIKVLASTVENVGMAVKESDVIIGAVLVPGRRAPDVVTKAMIRTMNPGAVIVDVAIDQGGCTEISMPPTSHSHPVRYVSIDSPDESEQDLQEAKGRFKGRHIIMYSVPNMPGAVPRTSTLGITNATLKYAQALAKKGLENAIKEDAALMKGVNTYKGHLTCKGVADALGMKFTPAESVFS